MEGGREGEREREREEERGREKETSALSSAGRTNHDLAATQFPRNCCAIILYTFFNLRIKLYNILYCFIMLIVLNCYNNYNLNLKLFHCKSTCDHFAWAR